MEQNGKVENRADSGLFDTLPDEELLAISDKLVEQNLEAYKELAT
jgi:hypothetical protein